MEDNYEDFCSVVKQHCKNLVYFAHQIVHNIYVAEDITNETFIKYWQLRDNFDTPAETKGFLYVTNRNACIDYLRGEKQKRICLTGFGYTMSSFCQQLEMEQETSLPELMGMVFKIIDKMPLKQKRAILLHYFGKYSFRQIAGEIGTSVASARKHCSRGIIKIRNSFKDF